jgi:uncharacterized protein (TIGR02996 family)
VWHATKSFPVAALLSQLAPISLGDKAAHIDEKIQTIEMGGALVVDLERLISNVPFTSDSTKPVWKQIFASISKSQDPRFAELAKSLPLKWKIRPLMADWMTGALRKATKEMKVTETKLSEPAIGLLEHIATALIQKDKTGASKERAFAAVWAEPQSDSARMVCADMLQELGDPRGEFIALQMMQNPTKESVKKMKSLLKAHLNDFLGPLVSCVTKGDAVFTKGFLSAATAKFKNQQEALKYGALDEWATVEKIDFTFSYGSSQEQWSHYVSPKMKSLKHVQHIPAVSLPALIKANKNWGIEKLSVGRVQPEQLKVLLHAPNLTNLRELTLYNDEPECVAELSRAPVLRILRLSNGSHPGQFLPVLSEGLLEQVIIEVPDSSELRFTRGSDGRLSKLSIFSGDRPISFQLTERLATLTSWTTDIDYLDTTNSNVIEAAEKTRVTKNS